MRVLGVLQQEPGTEEGLFTGGAGIAGWLVPTCRHTDPWESELSEKHVTSKNPATSSMTTI